MCFCHAKFVPGGFPINSLVSFKVERIQKLMYSSMGRFSDVGCYDFAKVSTLSLTSIWWLVVDVIILTIDLTCQAILATGHREVRIRTWWGLADFGLNALWLDLSHFGRMEFIGRIMGGLGLSYRKTVKAIFWAEFRFRGNLMRCGWIWVTRENIRDIW